MDTNGNVLCSSPAPCTRHCKRHTLTWCVPIAWPPCTQGMGTTRRRVDQVCDECMRWWNPWLDWASGNHFPAAEWEWIHPFWWHQGAMSSLSPCNRHSRALPTPVQEDLQKQTINYLVPIGFEKKTVFLSYTIKNTTTTKHSTAQHSTAQHSTAQPSTAQRLSYFHIFFVFLVFLFVFSRP